MFTIIIPAYNEINSLEKTVEELRRFVRKELKENFLLIIAEDGSTDGTDKLAKSLDDKYKNVLHLHSDKRLGKGLAIKNTVDFLRGDIVFIMDCGLSTDISALMPAITELRSGASSADIVVGSRYLRDSKIKRSFFRYVFSRFYILFVKILFKTKLSDIQCGFKGFKIPVFKQVNRFVESNDWFWDTEFLINANETSHKTKEISIEWTEQENTKINSLKDGWSMFISLLKLRFKK